MSPLATEVVGDRNAPRIVWFVHGILGQGRNWRSFARRVVEAAPAFRGVLMDLRCHGQSTGPGFAPPHDLAAAAADLTGLAQQDGWPDVVVGHSFGGKVVVHWARDPRAHATVWVLDSPPGATPSQPKGAADPASILSLLRRIEVPATDRDALRRPLRDAGVPEPVVAWLLTSARRDPDGWRWVWDLDGVEALLASYLREDLWNLVERSDRIHLVRAQHSDRWSEADLRRLGALAAVGRAHVVADAGHWLHVDAPDAVFALLRSSFDVRP